MDEILEAGNEQKAQAIPGDHLSGSLINALAGKIVVNQFVSQLPKEHERVVLDFEVVVIAQRGFECRSALWSERTEKLLSRSGLPIEKRVVSAREYCARDESGSSRMRV